MPNLWIKRALWLAALWNMAGGASALLDPAGHFALLYRDSLALEQPLQLFFYQCTWINVIAWGIAYLLAARLPASRIAIMAAGGAGKLVYFAASLQLFLSGIGTSMLLASGMLDLALALVFAMAIITLRQDNRTETGKI